MAEESGTVETGQESTDIGSTDGEAQSLLSEGAADKSSEEGAAEKESETPEKEGEEKPAEGEEKPKEGEEEKKAEEGAPEQYEDFKIPEGSELLDEVLMGEFKDMAKLDNMTQETAQKYVDMGNKIGERVVELQQKAWNEQRESWRNEAKNDPEFGGQKFGETQERIARFMNKFGDDELKELSNTLGFGDHKAMIRLAIKVDKATGEGKVIEGAATSTKKENMTVGERLYGKK